MSSAVIEYASAAVCAVAGVIYIRRAYRREITLQITSWALWSFIGFVVLLTYHSASDEASFWAAVVSFTTPTIVTAILTLEGGHWDTLGWLDYLCIVCSISALIVWLVIRDNRELAQFALYLAIIADLCAAIPTIWSVWRNPEEDRPGAWIFFGVGMGISLFAITDWTPANVTYAVYMMCGSSSVALPLVTYRLRNRIPLAQWI